MRDKKWVELFGSEEWAWVVKLGSAMHEPEAKKIFWETVKAKKEADPEYSVYSDFPKALPGDEFGLDAKKFPGADICADILETLSVHKKDESA